MRWSKEDEILYEDPRSSYKIEFFDNNRNVLREDLLITSSFLDVLKAAHNVFISFPRDGSLDSLMPSMRMNHCRISRQTKSGWSNIIDTDSETIEDRIQQGIEEDEDYELGYNSSPMLGQRYNDLRGFGRGKK